MSNSTAFYKSPIGILKIESDDENILAILFVNSWKGIKINESEIVFETIKHPIIIECILQLSQYFEGHLKALNLPIKLEGTGFQQQVWNQLLTIPYGKTLSYSQLSKKINNINA